MVLDYSKVNSHKHESSNQSVSSSQGSNKTKEPKNSTNANDLRTEPLFVTDQECDVALITEEVVDGRQAKQICPHRTRH